MIVLFVSDFHHDALPIIVFKYRWHSVSKDVLISFLASVT